MAILRKYIESEALANYATTYSEYILTRVALAFSVLACTQLSSSAL
jgi:hypothetical protein